MYIARLLCYASIKPAAVRYIYVLVLHSTFLSITGISAVKIVASRIIPIKNDDESNLYCNGATTTYTSERKISFLSRYYREVFEITRGVFESIDWNRRRQI